MDITTDFERLVGDRRLNKSAPDQTLLNHEYDLASERGGTNFTEGTLAGIRFDATTTGFTVTPVQRFHDPHIRLTQPPLVILVRGCDFFPYVCLMGVIPLFSSLSVIDQRERRHKFEKLKFL